MITSPQNQQVKAWKKLQQRKYRKKTGSFIVEGFHLTEEAYQSGWEIERMLIREDTAVPGWANHLKIAYLSGNVFKEIAETKTPQGIAAVVRIQTQHESQNGKALVIDNVQDPGNLGTMIRTADALGFSQVVLGQGSVDVFNEKVLRASQGSIFHLPVIEKNLELFLPELRQAGFTIWASTLEQATPLQDAYFSERMALIVGNEGEGIQSSLLEIADRKVSIPITGKAESLNVAVAAGIMMYEISKE